MGPIVIVDMQEEFAAHIPKKLPLLIGHSARGRSACLVVLDVVDNSYPTSMVSMRNLRRNVGSIMVVEKMYGGTARQMIDAGLRDEFVEASRLLREHNIANEFAQKHMIHDAEIVDMINENSVEWLRNFPGVPTLVGGDVNQCLAEISVLMDCLGIDHVVDDELTYGHSDRSWLSSYEKSNRDARNGKDRDESELLGARQSETLCHIRER